MSPLKKANTLISDRQADGQTGRPMDNKDVIPI